MYDWKPWKFENIPKGFWNELPNQRAFFDDFAKEHQISSVDDWAKLNVCYLLKISYCI
jgi:hypothetical protein